MHLHPIFKTSLFKIIVINLIVFITVGLVNLLFKENIAGYLALVGPWKLWSVQIWGSLTYMFVQVDFLHLLFNMLWLWAFGMIIIRLSGGRDFVSAYIISGLIGGLTFLIALSATGLPVGYLIGSSSSVMGVIAYCGIRYSRQKVNLILFGMVEIRWVAIIALIICGVAPGLGNTPTLAAHIGGALGGAVLAIVRKFMSAPQFNISKKKASKVYNVRQHERRGMSDSEQAEFDDLLRIVSRSGYKSLSDRQKRRLFELSDKIQHKS